VNKPINETMAMRKVHSNKTCYSRRLVSNPLQSTCLRQRVLLKKGNHAAQIYYKESCNDRGCQESAQKEKEE